MVTAGWISLTSIDKPEIVVTQTTAAEHHAIAQGHDGYLQVESRINAALGRTDLRCAWLARVEESSPMIQGTTFQEFRKSYQPPRLLFRDILGHESLASEASRTTRSEFERGGGKVLVLE